MGIYIKDSFDNDIQEEVEFLIDSCLMESVENPFEYVKWFYENALIYSARADGKVVANSGRLKLASIWVSGAAKQIRKDNS